MVATTRLLQRFADDRAALGTDRALSNLQAALVSQPLADWLAIVAAMRAQDDADSARKFLALTLSRWPDRAEPRVVAADIVWRDGQPDVAESLLRDVLSNEPHHLDAAMTLARILQTQGRFSAASQTISAACDATSIPVHAAIDAVRFIQECQRHRVAANVAENQLAHGHDDASMFALAGNIRRELGDFDIARSHYHEALRRDVDLNRWFVPGSLALAQRFTSTGDADFRLLHAQLGNVALSPRARASTTFGLAKAYDDIGDYASAATHFRTANSIARGLQTWSRRAFDASVAERIGARIAKSIAHDASFTPIFVVGLPRTGTTLASVQLAKRAGVRDRGELPLLGFIAKRLIAERATNDASALREAAELYRAHVRQDDAPATHYIDQNPLNFLFLDIATAMFPNARVVHCVRGRRDTALSIYQQFFAHDDYGFAYDFADIAAFANAHDTLLAHWKSLLPLDIHTLRYEDMVRDPVATLEHLHTFVGSATEIDSASHSAITSSSLWQARQPIHAASVGRWRNYAAYFAELDTLFPA